MNSIKFNGRPNFPLSIETMTFLQEIISESAKLSRLGGESYILSGCQENGLNVSEGIVILNGELMKFEGGQKQEYIYIAESKRSVVASGYNFPDVYTTRSARFGYADERFKWEDLKRVQSNLELSEAISNITSRVDSLQGFVAGMVILWWGDPANPPAGWALCDGLDGRPNTAGRFPVGYNQNDEDYNAVGKTGGAKEVTLGETNIPKHQHYYTTTDDSWNSDNQSTNVGIEYYKRINGNGADGNDHSTAIFKTSPYGEADSQGNPSGHENRPPYMTFCFIIKL